MPLEPSSITTEVIEIDGGVRITVAGEIDSTTGHELGPVLLKATARGDRLELDLTDVVFIDSAGLRVLIEAWASVREGASFEVVGTSPMTLRVFQETGLDATFGLRTEP